MLLILSGRYVTQELQLEIGRLPPVFLPVGGKILLELLVKTHREKLNILTLPFDYELTDYEKIILEENNVEVLRVSPNDTIGEVINKSLITHLDNAPLTILYGDTFINNRITESNHVGTSITKGSYEWSVYSNEKMVPSFTQNKLALEGEHVFNGTIKFSNANEFLKKLDENENDIVRAINSLLITKKIKVKFYENWFDFGHVKTYFDSKKLITTERHFNELSFDNGFFIKKSQNRLKIIAEYKWFKSLPEELEVYTPRVRFLSNTSYGIEYLDHFTLSELWVFGKLPTYKWKKILIECFKYLTTANRVVYPKTGSNWDWLNKTEVRLQQYDQEELELLEKSFFASGYSIKEVLSGIHELYDVAVSEFVLIHGDFCFSNILYDFRSEHIYLIDPRGYDFDCTETSYGPVIYDLAKLHHSILGRYDEIVSGKYTIEKEEETDVIRFSTEVDCAVVDTYWDNVKSMGYERKSVIALSLQLFVSMIPLHRDCRKRQYALLLNARRLYEELIL